MPASNACSAKAGSTPCARHPDETLCTYWDYFRQPWQRNGGLRIDHLLLSPRLAPGPQDAGVHRWVRGLEKTSDHAPTWIRCAAPA